MVKFDTLYDDGTPAQCTMDGYLKDNLIPVKDAVLNKGFDYISVVAGIPGAGKSTLAQQICKFLDPTFTTKDRICFSGGGENGLIERTSKAKKGQAFILDESFESLNTKVSRGSDFVRIMNHLQLIRQKGLFILLVLPNFFDLSKGLAIFRTTHLFVVYAENYKRGTFLAFDRDLKRELYVRGNKFMDYNCVKANFYGSFIKKWIANEELYDKLKLKHLIEQGKDDVEKSRYKVEQARDNLVKYLRNTQKLNTLEIANIGKISRKTVYNIINKED